MSMYPNGMNSEERRLQALWVARDCTADKMEPKLTLQAAQDFSRADEPAEEAPAPEPELEADMVEAILDEAVGPVEVEAPVEAPAEAEPVAKPTRRKRAG
jgi:hypothetical protein